MIKSFRCSSGTIRFTTRGIKKSVDNVKTFYTEYNTLKRLRGIGGIINLLDADTDKGELWLDYHKLDLHEYIINNNKTVGITKDNSDYIEESVNIFKKLLEPINECHKLDILHGDLKPENILLDEHSNPILIDFGHSVNLHKIQVLGTNVGTDGFRAPELDKNIIGYFTDVYSLGITFYTLLLGKKPLIRKNGELEIVITDHESDIPYKLINLMCDMTDECYENRPSIEYIIEEIKSDFT